MEDLRRLKRTLTGRDRLTTLRLSKQALICVTVLLYICRKRDRSEKLVRWHTAYYLFAKTEASNQEGRSKDEQ